MFLHTMFIHELNQSVMTIQILDQFQDFRWRILKKLIYAYQYSQCRQTDQVTAENFL